MKYLIMALTPGEGKGIMTAKHTPWRITGTGIYEADGAVVACRNPHQTNDARWTRHARLIAAAPDLLGACKAALALLEQSIGIDRTPDGAAYNQLSVKLALTGLMED